MDFLGFLVISRDFLMIFERFSKDLEGKEKKSKKMVGLGGVLV